MATSTEKGKVRLKFDSCGRDEEGEKRVVWERGTLVNWRRRGGFHHLAGPSMIEGATKFSSWEGEGECGKERC